MSTWRVNNSTALGGEVCAPWQPNHAYSLGARCVCRTSYGTVDRRAYVYECTTAGTSHASTEPTWPTSGTVNDNGVVWTCRAPTDGNWDNASCYLYYITEYAAAGDTIYVDDGHSEAGIGGTLTITSAGTLTNPLRIFCVDKATDGLSTGAVIASGNYDIRFHGAAYSYGVKYNAGNNNLVFSRLADAAWIFESNGNSTVLECAGYLYGYSSGYRSTCKVINANIELTAYTAGIRIDTLMFQWLGGKLVAPNGLNMLLFTAGGAMHWARLRDVDLDEIGQGATTALAISIGSNDATYDVLFERCKLPSDAGFSICNSAGWQAWNSGSIRAHHCSAGNQSYDFYEDSSEGIVQDETTIVRTGGASDGATGLSCKMVSSARCIDGINGLQSIPIFSYTEATTEKTFTIELVHDSATALQDDEIWMELEYPADNSSGLGAIASSRCALLGTPADVPDSSETWTTTGLTNPNTRKLSVTVTPGKAGPITARVFLAKASTTVYIDPVITES